MLRTASVTALCAVALFQPAAAHAQTGAAEEEIVVTATRSAEAILDVPAAVSTVTTGQLEQQGFRTGADEFRAVPGVSFRRAGGDNDDFLFVNFRGVTGNHGNDTFVALIDGVPFVGPDEEVLLREVPYDVLDRIEVVRGPVSALYGRGGLVGAVNYITRLPIEDANRLSASFGSDDFYRGVFTLERAFTNGAALVGTVAREEYGGWRDNQERETTSAFFRGQLPLTDRLSISASLNYSDRYGEIDGYLPLLADGSFAPGQIDRSGFLGFGSPFREFETLGVVVRADYEVSEDLSLQATLHARRTDGSTFLNFYDSFGFDPANSIMTVNGFGSPFDDSTTQFAEALVRWSPGRHNIVAGINYETTDYEEADLWTGQNGFTFGCGFTFYAINIDWRTGAVLNAGHPCFVTNDELRRSDSTGSAWAVFVQDEIALTDHLTLTLGGRYDSFERDVFTITPASLTGDVLSDDANAFAPKASLSYDWGDTLVYASYGRGFNANFGAMFQWDPFFYVRDTEPTTVDSYEVGLKGRAIDGRLTYAVSAFYLEQENRAVFLTNPDSFVDPTAPSNLVTSGQLFTSRGLEVEGRFELSDEIAVRASYAYVAPEWDELVLETFGGPVDLSGNSPTGVPENTLTGAIEWRPVDGFEALLSVEWYDDYFVTLDNSVEKGGYTLSTLNLGFEPQAWAGARIDLNISNLFDEEYDFFFGDRTQATYAIPGTPRQARVTLRYAF